MTTRTREATDAISSVEDAITLASTRPEMRPLKPASDALIAAAEARLGLEFPPSYRLFLMKAGVLSFGSKDMFGLTGPDFDHNTAPCAVFMTLGERPAGMPVGYVVVFAVGEGTLYAIDTSQPDSPVVEWFGVTVRRRFSNFGDLLLHEVQREFDNLEAADAP